LIPFAVTVCGAVVMCMEIMAFRVLAPTFGSSVYVTGSIIGIFLAMLSLGYYLGGILADRRPDRSTFAIVIVGAGVLAAAIQALREPFLTVARGGIQDIRWSASLYVALLFGPSTLLFGMISPYAIRLSSTDLRQMGNISGRLFALSTFGSIFGTLFTSFYLIGWFPISRIIVGAGLITLALGVLLLATSAVGRRAIAPMCLLALLASPGPTTATSSEPTNGGTTLYQRDTNYHRIIVLDDGTWRTLRFNRSPQSSMLKKDVYRGGYRYTDGFHLGPAHFPEAKSALFIGCGAATVPKQFRKFYPQMQVDVVEIDPVVVEVAKKYFGFQPDAKTRVEVQDGRVFLAGTKRTYDLIYMDAYYADAVPFHLTTVEFMRIIKSHLSPNGVAVFNIISAMEGSDSKLARSEYRTIRKVFPTCSVFPIIDGDEKPQQYSKSRVRNVIMVATDRPALGPQELSQRVARLKNARLPYLETIAASYHAAELPTRDVPELTDDFAPVDNLLPLP
jgi:spermidine synthase